MKRAWLAVLFLSLAPVAMVARAPGSAEIGFNSLKFERGARASAMGGAYVAAADSTDALFWNPAGLSGLRRLQLMASHQVWIEGISDQQIALGIPWYGVGAWGVGITYVSAKFDGRNDFGVSTGTFNGYDMTLQASLEVDIARWLSAGMTYRLLRQDFGQIFGLGSAFDVGVQFRQLMDKRLTIGLAAVNMGTPVSLGNSQGPLPLLLKGGVAIKLIKKRLTISADESYEPKIDIFETRLGGEYANRVGEIDYALRGGYVIGPRQEAGSLSGMALGAGFGLSGFMLDYAWQPIGDFGSSHKVSLTYTFD